tara:strand:+ start:249 stop:431 length:183 start_codon:yes stop_codon:yes gene_type:complete
MSNAANWVNRMIASMPTDLSEVRAKKYVVEEIEKFVQENILTAQVHLCLAQRVVIIFWYL